MGPARLSTWTPCGGGWSPNGNKERGRAARRSSRAAHLTDSRLSTGHGHTTASEATVTLTTGGGRHLPPNGHIPDHPPRGAQPSGPDPTARAASRDSSLPERPFRSPWPGPGAFFSLPTLPLPPERAIEWERKRASHHRIVRVSRRGGEPQSTGQEDQ